VAVLVKRVVSLMHTLVTQVLCGNVVQVIGDFHKYLEVQREVNIVITKCGTLQEVLHCLVMQEDQETGVLVNLPTLVHVSTV
jgi:predicted nucleotidyltransferase